MLKEVIAHLDFSVWAEISFSIFAITFLAVAIRTLLSDKRLAERHAAIALNDSVETDDE
jgi:hypothetical protein